MCASLLSSTDSRKNIFDVTYLAAEYLPRRQHADGTLNLLVGRRRRRRRLPGGGAGGGGSLDLELLNFADQPVYLLLLEEGK